MKFACKKISITNEVVGCTIAFSEKEDLPLKKATIDEIVASIGQYVILQRTCAEEDGETDYYYFETSTPGKSGELKDFSMTVSRNKFIMTVQDEIIEISMNNDDQEFENLKKTLCQITNNRGQIVFHE